MGRGDYILAEEVRNRMDKQFEKDLKMMKQITNYNRSANNMYSRSELIGKTIRSDATVLMELKSDMTDLRRTLDDLLTSDTIIASDAFGEKLANVSKWDDRIKNLNLDVENKIGKSVVALKKEYRQID